MTNGDKDSEKQQKPGRVSSGAESRREWTGSKVDGLATEEVVTFKRTFIAEQYRMEAPPDGGEG